MSLDNWSLILVTAIYRKRHPTLVCATGMWHPRSDPNNAEAIKKWNNDVVHYWLFALHHSAFFKDCIAAKALCEVRILTSFYWKNAFLVRYIHVIGCIQFIPRTSNTYVHMYTARDLHRGRMWIAPHVFGLRMNVIYQRIFCVTRGPWNHARITKIAEDIGQSCAKCDLRGHVNSVTEPGIIGKNLVRPSPSRNMFYNNYFGRNTYIGRK